jgi:hypothetical protein
MNTGVGEIISPLTLTSKRKCGVIKTRLNNGHWTSPMGATGIHEVRGFLQGQADEDVINEAIRNLSLYRQVYVKAA